jgi:hypothetical protein
MAKLMLYLGSLFFTLMLQLLMNRWNFWNLMNYVMHVNRSTPTVRGNDLHQRLEFPSNAKEGQEENSGSQGTSRTEGQNCKSIVLLTITDSLKAIKKGGKKR